MSAHPFKQVDVFSKGGFNGNPVAVVFNADDLSTDQMQKFAVWTNLSETTFVLKPTIPEAHYKLRIFTPKKELPFAGHPTIGSCYAVIESGVCLPKNGKVIQECEAGLINITLHREDSGDVWYAFELTEFTSSEVSDEVAIAILNCLFNANGQIQERKWNPIFINVGPIWLTIQLDSAHQVLNLYPDYGMMANLSEQYGFTGVYVFGKHDDMHIESRAFAPAINVVEDPACGSGAAACGIYVYLSNNKLGRDFDGNLSISQGCKVGRAANLNVVTSLNTNGSLKVKVGGSASTCIEGSVNI
ncbi:enhancer-RNA-mediated silencing [Schizosaccharomyces cryophilus OY26]|uniref:Enhancer-RNA-mediated silencing n=1 Tax=Schizosaccharomyces cryophilus (strain OY26 / ATCC MYA-4695 / CBS 11777 / NBRC 106824 / NRRL Y48691) TaxID=653667 RepID=S9X8I5_SCHCR|nr:enhancer-RNA-mediated silencing [Schizosaccharomyces cryophilus OY26]EPY50141.1 enhancer-RNA-mediated silencing [Schizosaccharomyces cryophilus OY26]